MKTKLTLLVLSAFLLISTVGCASRQAALNLTQAQKCYATFQKDYAELSKNSLEREWILRSVMRNEAKNLDTKDATITGAQAKALIDKYETSYQKDILAIETQRTKHLQAMVNAQMGNQLVTSVAGYHSEGVTGADVADMFANSSGVPGLSELIASYAASKGGK
jgi:hypothetical protein